MEESKKEVENSNIRSLADIPRKYFRDDSKIAVGGSEWNRFISGQGVIYDTRIKTKMEDGTFKFSIVLCVENVETVSEEIKEAKKDGWLILIPGVRSTGNFIQENLI